MAIKGGVVGLQGTIGSGKSTLVKFLKTKEGKKILREYIPKGIPIEVVYEPVDPYARRAFYRDIVTNTDRFELSQGMNRLLRHAWALTFNGVVILDTTLLVGFGSYGINSFRNEGTLTHDGWEAYVQLIKREACDKFGRDKERESRWLESGLLYLKVEDAKLLQARQIERRNPHDGGPIPLDYLERLNRRNMEFTANPGEVYSDMFCLTPPEIETVDASVDIKTDSDYLKNCTNKLGELIKRSLVRQGGLR